MKIAVVGCSHGELDKIYGLVQHMENERQVKVDLLICCGDFQATRNESDLRCMSVPPKYYNMGSFYKYYSEEKVAPVLTIFIGGNHEASNYLQELPFGGWVAPRIYYLGYAGVVNFGGLRIGGISGIYKGFDYMKGHFERAPYNESAKKSVYHIRNVEVFRLKQISESMDIMLSHDWPRGVYNYGCKEDLIKNKPFFAKEVDENTLGSKPTEELLTHLKPKYWFSAHLHTKFCATIRHDTDSNSSELLTEFMALDKCLPRRKWLEIIDVPTNGEPLELNYDLEWLTILHFTDHLMSSKHVTQFMPGPSSNERWSFVPTDEEKEFIRRKMNDDLRIPENFVKTAQSFEKCYGSKCYQPHAVINPQTTSLCNRLGVKDPLLNLIDYSVNDLSSPSPKSCSTPERFGSTPERFSYTPEWFGHTPERFGRTPERFGHTPERFGSNDSTYLSFDSPSDISTSFSTNRSSISSIVSSPPIVSNLAKKPKFSFPSIIDNKTDESTDSGVLPFFIDRTGSMTESETSPVKKEFKRRNASLYAEQNE